MHREHETTMSVPACSGVCGCRSVAWSMRSIDAHAPLNRAGSSTCWHGCREQATLPRTP